MSSKSYWYVKRLRLLDHLVKHGFKEYEVIPDPANKDYNWFVFEKTPELEAAVEEYYAQRRQ